METPPPIVNTLGIPRRSQLLGASRLAARAMEDDRGERVNHREQCSIFGRRFLSLRLTFEDLGTMTARIRTGASLDHSMTSLSVRNHVEDDSNPGHRGNHAWSPLRHFIRT